MAEKKKGDSKEKPAKKMVVRSSSDYVGANVRDKEGKVISYIPDGKRVTVIGEFDTKKERTEISGTDHSGKNVKGSVLTSVLHW